MFGLASLGSPSNPYGLGSGTQNSALTPQSLMMGSIPASLQTSQAIGNTSLSPLAMLLAGFGIGK